MLFAITTFILIAGSITGAYWLLAVRPERRAQQNLRRRLEALHQRSTETPTIVTDQRFSRVALLQSLLLRTGKLTRPLQILIEQAGVRFTVGTFVLASLFAALLGFVGIGVVTRSFSFQIAAALIMGMLPLVYVRRAKEHRRCRFEELFPEALEIIARSLRAGHAFTTGLAIAADEVPEPVGGELKKLYDSQNYGRPFEEAIRDFAQRAPILDARFFATAVLTQRETGGNLSEVLDNLTTVIRDRFRVKRQVRVLTAQGRFSGWVLAAAPPALALLLLFINPDHVLSMVRDPIGVQLLIAALILQLVGTLLIRRIVNVQY